MHLLAAQPGGFVDDEGIIDLQQSPADLIILATADSVLAALAQAAESLPNDFPSLRLANCLQLSKPAAFDLYQHKVLDQATIVVLSLLGGESYWRYGVQQLQAWAKADVSRVLICVSGDNSPDPHLFAASTVNQAVCQQVWRYLRESGIDNARQLLSYLADQYLHYPCKWQAPQAVPACMIYLSSSIRSTTTSTSHKRSKYADLATWQHYYSQKYRSNNDDHDNEQPLNNICLVLFYRSHLQSANTAMFDALMQQLEQQNITPLAVAITSLKDQASLDLINHLLQHLAIQLILNSTGFASNRHQQQDKEHAYISSEPLLYDSPFVRDVPILQVILASTVESDWQTHHYGLRSRDLAMQVVLPEMDGRIITRAISFKSVQQDYPRCEFQAVMYALQPDRAAFVAELAQRYLQLANKPNDKKRIALILANYPTKDGRIGNGVGLDTPASCVTLLRALQAAHYPVADLPENGDELLQRLLAVITNNPANLHYLPCWQSLALDIYWQHFQTLPQENQQAILNRWGQPEDDPKYRQGRLMLAGIRLGETFVGIQPARGFERDLSANYHDPDLVPPHSYLAFYFWLRHVYQVDAIVHIGKHGNLEWLPGKSVALSAQCWADIALGAMPHFYPFIVNDPGEGAQAKRRTQAVIIDHLMPPMTRAESYGELAELEQLVDEYYQALGLDTGRENFLREQIVAQLQQSHLLEEIVSQPINDQTGNDHDQPLLADDTLLNELDAYLCDIKEAQIRHGLHRLGELPNDDKLADTLVALLRLPRGTAAASQGILHNLAQDLKLPEDFDPLAINAQTWQGNRPQVLQTISEQAWRTDADTRERLELLAKNVIQRFVLAKEDLSGLAVNFSRTHQQLQYVRDRLQPILQESAKREIQALISGLSGQFVPPGASGAPTRGRLDVLPTGRNFFAVDNRAIPSWAAWQLGQRSAQALIDRHLQTHGDYPKQVGLSVWGTATMRTGGDDIAQAFALMGVKPVWASGSQRVIDFEIIPTMQLGRPRIDVTLRVSGFFRDAFPNVMKLYDAAVQALAVFEDAGGGNTIRETIEARAKALQAEGYSAEQAQRSASYRVFGSKPSAYGAGLQGLIDERCWENAGDLAEAYLNWGAYAYGNQQGDGVADEKAFHHRLTQLDTVIHNQDNREHDLLDSDDYYQFQGGMTNAVQHYRGAAPTVYHNDHSNPTAPKVRTLKEELNRVLRSRVLNPKWIQAMQEHGYKGAFEMAATVDYLFAYGATTQLVADYQYEKITDSLLFEPENQAFLQQYNPHALEEMAERLLEAIQRGLWQDENNYAAALQDLLLALDEKQEGQSF